MTDTVIAAAIGGGVVAGFKIAENIYGRVRNGKATVCPVQNCPEHTKMVSDVNVLETNMKNLGRNMDAGFKRIEDQLKVLAKSA